MNSFQVKVKYTPQGDQPKAIKKLSTNINNEFPGQTLLGVTGSGKTFTIANMIEKVGKPTLIMAHNKTLAAQLYEEFKEVFLTTLFIILLAIMIIINQRHIFHHLKLILLRFKDLTII